MIDAQAIQDEYAKYGRTASQADIDSHQGNPDGIQGVAALLAKDSGRSTSPPASSSTGDWLKKPYADWTGSAATTNTTGQQDVPVSQVGHDGTYNGMNREQWRDTYLGMNGQSQDALNAWLQANGATKQSDNGTYLTPYGESLDLQIGARTGQAKPGWTDYGGQGSATGSIGAGGQGTGTTGAAAGTGGVDSNGQRDDLFNTLLARAHQGLDVSRTDPAVRSQADAYAANAERSRRDYLSANAEKSSPYSQGAQQGQERMTAEQVGQNTGAFESELVGREIQSRRDEIQNALTQMGGMLSQDQQVALQKELAQLNASLQQQQINNQNGQFYSQLGQQNTQFNSNLGFNVDQQQAYWDALRSGLLGG